MIVRARKQGDRVEIVDTEVINEIENNQVSFSKNHKFKYNGEEYTKLGD